MIHLNILSMQIHRYINIYKERIEVTHIIRMNSIKIAGESVDRSTIVSPVCLEFTT